MKLDAKKVVRLALPAGKADHIEWDDDMPGFGLRLRRSGDAKVRRSWVVQYRRACGTRRILLGSAEVLGAATPEPGAISPQLLLQSADEVLVA